MPSVFVNRNGRQNRRDIRSLQPPSSPPTGTVKELIVIPAFDTFIFYQAAGASGGDRWSRIIPSASTPSTSTEIPVGLFNPWNDGADAPNGTTQAPRTPTRGILAFNLSGLTAGANILDAKLNFTISRHNNWLGTT